MFDDRILKLARDKKNVCYLVHTKVLRDKICIQYPEYTRALIDKDLDDWLDKRAGREVILGEDVAYIRVMCYQTFAALLRRDTTWL